MGLFSRKNNDSSPANPAMAELGREFAIAQRHGDRRKVREINRKIRSGDMTETDRNSFDQGHRSYADLPPVPGFKRNRRRR